MVLKVFSKKSRVVPGKRGRAGLQEKSGAFDSSKAENETVRTEHSLNSGESTAA
jgi:hypothetical protein